MEEQARMTLRDLTAQIRAAFANVPENERLTLIDQAYAEVRAEMTQEGLSSGELRPVQSERARTGNSALQAV